MFMALYLAFWKILNNSLNDTDFFFQINVIFDTQCKYLFMVHFHTQYSFMVPFYIQYLLRVLFHTQYLFKVLFHNQYLLRVAFHTRYLLVKGTISHTEYLFRGAFSEKGKFSFRVLFKTFWSRMISSGQ